MLNTLAARITYAGLFLERDAGQGKMRPMDSVIINLFAAIWRAALLCVVCLAVGSVPVRAELMWSQQMASAALDGPLKYSLYLPPGYHDPREEAQAKRYPVVYVLPGVGDNERAYPAFARVEMMADRLMTSGAIEPMILVMPNGRTSWYVDSATVGGPGNYATAITVDLVKHIDDTYRTLADRSGRFVTGHSMGGFGALRFAFEKPEVFSLTAAMSSALWDRVTPDFELQPRMERIFQGSFGSPFKASNFLAQRPRAYINDLNKRLAASDLELGIFLSAGDDDQFRAYASTFRLFSELREAEIAVELRIHDGGHSWELWRERALPAVLSWMSERYLARRSDNLEN